MTRPYALLRAGFPYLTTLGEFARIHFPCDIAIARDGTLFSYGKGRNYDKGFSGPISITNLNDENLGSFGWRADDLPVAHATFMWPCQMIMDRDENLYTSDTGAHRISRFTRDGEYLGKWGEHGASKGQVDRPSGIAFDQDDDMYVVDTMNHRIQKFTKTGRFLMSWGRFGEGDGEFNMPWGITVDELGNVYVSDWRNDRVQKFTADGEFIFQFGRTGQGNGEFYRPAGIDVDKDGDIYVVDWGNNRVQLFTHEGRYVEQFHGDATISKSTVRRFITGSGRLRRMRDYARLEQEKSFARPRSVRVDDQGHMYVPDYEHYRIQVYKKEAYPLDETEIIPPFRVPTLNAN